eukprot:CAMPEP_0182424656 /NCGR_PEP_ID=MMETSP1167-20130531/10888_1 /TAXON_ID=2988 /ORGANISM="Mallomonas Sp, Strain CCMP3275" /LENGTH=732 /DNA_ID=CAMNT_0024604629 /DNA_START=58 /DNA_END=2253 /DNA_ORIENTATION=+
MDFLSSQVQRLSMNTSEVSVISHTHGREMRQLRDINKRDLQSAVKYGRKERAAPGRKGDERWKYIYGGIVYVTDESSRHEITSWRLEDKLEQPQAPIGSDCGFSSHTIIVVDCSGSMRTPDCPGFSTRTKCTYECLSREFVEPQLRLNETEGSVGDMMVSLIEMRQEATLLLRKVPVDPVLLRNLRRRGDIPAYSHGHYLPALEEVENLIKEDVQSPIQFFVVFLSDGAPSDHIHRTCEHGVQVWLSDGTGVQKNIKGKMKAALKECGKRSSKCRVDLKSLVEMEILRKVRDLGDMCGRDRIRIHTVAFGNPNEDFRVLKQMSNQLPRHSFQKLGLSSICLSTAFSSLSSSLTSLRTESGGTGKPKTLRQIEKDQPSESWDCDVFSVAGGWTLYGLRRKVSPTYRICGESDCTKDGEFQCSICKTKRYCCPEHQKSNWKEHKQECSIMNLERLRWATLDVPELVRKQKYNMDKGVFVDIPLHPGATGVVVKSKFFSKGVERAAFQCRECVWDGSMYPRSMGPRLIAKETLHEELLFNADFHKEMCKLQAEATSLADLFNTMITRNFGRQLEWHISFIQCHIYEVVSTGRNGNKAWILGETELEGNFVKWNNNNGKVLAKAPASLSGNNALGAILEEEEEEEEEEYGASLSAVFYTDIPQCFSHFTYSITGGRSLVCDLQGVWNEYDGFVLTDPAIHSSGGACRNGPTDKGDKGITNFFDSHICSVFCEGLGL